MVKHTLHKVTHLFFFLFFERLHRVKDVDDLMGIFFFWVKIDVKILIFGKGDNMGTM